MGKSQNLLVRLATNYFSRHKNNINRVLHLIGIPLALFGIIQLCTAKWELGLMCLSFGYLSQWVGHSVFEKNELGEVLLIKRVIKKLFKE